MTVGNGVVIPVHILLLKLHDQVMAVTRVEALSELPQALRTWPSRKDSITILVTGRSHAGKSALINEIIGHRVAVEADTLSRGADEVQGYSFKYAGLDLRVTLWDSPGLQDGSFRDKKYVGDMRSHGCADADLMFYCINISDTRFRQEDIDAVANLTAGLGKTIWNTAIFVMTFANRVVECPIQLCDFQHRLRSWKRRLIQALERTGVDVEISATIPVVPVGCSAKQVLPDREDWLESLWHETICRVQVSMLSTHKESKRLLDLALRAGFVGVTVIVCVVLGPPGVGKTCIKYLLLDQRPPGLRSSTVCAETPVRIEIGQIPEARIHALKGNWREVKGEGMLDVVARMILLAGGGDDEVARKEASEGIFTKIVNWIWKAVASPDVTEACQMAIKNIMDELVQRIARLKSEGGELEALSVPLTEQLLRSMWVYLSDCGGLPQYHELLPLFVSRISSALCVTRLTDELDEFPVVEYYSEGIPIGGVPVQSQFSVRHTIQHLINTIQSCSTQEKPPSIILVGTHLDKLGQGSETLEEKNRVLLEMLEPQFSNQLVYSSRDMKQLLFTLNALNPGEREVNAMRHAIECSGAGEVKVPIWWYVLELLLQELAKELGRGVLSRAECLQMAELLNIREEPFDAALVYFDELNVIKYSPKVLPNVVFVNSQIPLDKVSELVCHSCLLRPNTQMTRRWMDFRDHGVVSDDILEHFPQHYVPGIFTKDDLSELLKSRLVFAEIPPPDWVKDTHNAKQKCCVMLSLLPTLPEAELEKYRVSSPVAATLLVRYPGGSRLAGVFCCLVTHLIQHCGWDLLLDSKQPLHRNCVVLQLLSSPPCTITLIDSNAHIEVHVDITAPVPPSEYAGHFPIIRQAILSGIRAACSKLNYQTIKPELAFLCSHASPSPPSPSPSSSADQPQEVKRHTATITKDKKYWYCDLQPRLSGLLDERHSIWFAAPRASQDAGTGQSRCASTAGDFPAALVSQKASASLGQPSSTDLSSLPHLDSQPSLAQLSVLKTAAGRRIRIISRLAPRWLDLGIVMDFDSTGEEIDTIERKHRGDPKECCRAVFQLWLRGHGVRPCSWRKLIEVLEYFDQDELAEEIQSALSASAN